jgi:hypothetical protein
VDDWAGDIAGVSEFLIAVPGDPAIKEDWKNFYRPRVRSRREGREEDGSIFGDL